MAKLLFGSQPSLAETSWSQLVETWQAMDETQWHSLWTYDHFVPAGPGADITRDCFEGWTALAGAALVTHRIRIGCLVTGNTYRNPVLVAKMAATIDHMSNGRLDVGLGASWHVPEHEAYGWDFSSMKETGSSGRSDSPHSPLI